MKKKRLLCLYLIYFYFFNNGLSLLSLSPPHSFENDIHHELNDTSTTDSHFSNDPPQQALNDTSTTDSHFSNDPPPPYSVNPPHYHSIPNVHREHIEFDPQRTRINQTSTPPPYSVDPPPYHSIPNVHREHIEFDPEFDPQMNGIPPLEGRRNIPAYSPDPVINARMQRLFNQHINPTSPSAIGSRLAQPQQNQQPWQNLPTTLSTPRDPYQGTINVLTSPDQNNQWYSCIKIPLEYYKIIVSEGSIIFYGFTMFLLISFLLNILWFLKIGSAVNIGISFGFFLVVSHIILIVISSIELRHLNRSLSVLQTLPIVIKDCIFLFLVLNAPFLFIYFSASLSTILSTVIVLLVIYAFCFVYKQYLHDKMRNEKTNFVKTLLQIPVDILIIMPCFTIFSLILGAMFWLITILTGVSSSRTY